MRLQLQSHASECGLASLAMVCSAHNLQQDLSELRRRFSVGLKGVTLQQLSSFAAALGFAPRAVRLELEELGALRLPCILHWDLNHFVVLEKVSGSQALILDPAVGKRRLTISEVSRHFTGVALEVTPIGELTSKVYAPRVSLSALTGKVTGLKRALLQILCVAVVLEFFAIAAPLLNQMVVDEVLTSGDRDLLTVLVLGFGLLLVVQTLISLSRSWMVIVLGQTLSLQLTGTVFAHLVRLPVEFFEKRHLGDITSRFGAVSAIQQTLTTSVIEAILDGLMAVAALVMMLVYAPMLAAITVGSVVLYGVLRWASYGPFRNASAERLVVAARENTHFLETLRAITPLKLFGREQERRARWQNLVVEVQNRDVRTARMSMIFSTANTFLSGLENLLVLWLGAKLVMSGMVNGSVSSGAGMTIGMLYAFISYKSQFSGRVSALINYAVELKMLGLHAERLADICLEPPEPDEAPANDLSHLNPCIELRGVSFRYSEGEPWILKDATFKIDAGQCVAIVGVSGAGKTTLLKIALGLLKPTEGEVLYGGRPIRHLGIANYRRQIGTVMQEDVLLTGSLADNIGFFDLRPDQARIETCARIAQLHEDIARMSMGYQTLVGDLGSGLSGGQKQRLLLARALYKQPRVLALDEATSHLDLGNERAVASAITRLQLTRLIVAHRPETIAGAQRVVQLRDGQVFDLARAAA
ncbi:peptidase domain-containing ABC transporter [Roseateles saccharophilus]|uniref:Colicin V processing peptidase n=2 Tax=Roseateles saccharophilus TaxID=304 RepID=A0A4R3UQ83_ROSSA|nr:peptidase domain-containing ABC transporter [Roseateles saccharophilus]TCU92488.1 colicin V processing peptidase [Roseateles saccharophilus]